MSSYNTIGDLQCLHALRLSSFDLLRQLAWEPAPQITMLCANFFHAMSPSTIQGEVDEEDDKMEEDVDPTEKRLLQIQPLEAHIKTMCYNPNHRSRRQVIPFTLLLYPLLVAYCLSTNFS